MLCARFLGVPSSVDSTGDWEIVMSEVPSLEWGKFVDEQIGLIVIFRNIMRFIKHIPAFVLHIYRKNTYLCLEKRI